MAETAVRNWIINQITGILATPVSEIRSDTNEIVFKEWTGMSQSGLEDIWIREDTQRAINNFAAGKGWNASLLSYKQRAAKILERAQYMVERRKQEYEESAQLISGVQPFLPTSMVKTVGTTTTCNAFLGVVVRKTLDAGKLARRNFPSFDLPNAGGPAWTWYPSSEKSPKAGDFYQVGKKGGMYQHVGIILSVNGETMHTADSGQGGPGAGYDAIKRKDRNLSGIMGWIDVDEFFKGWAGAGTAATP